MATGAPVLVVSTGAFACALPLDRVIETMRPLPIESIAGAPAFVRGVAVIRGLATPVIDLAAMLAGAREHPVVATRFVTVDSGGRRVALAVAAVLGVRHLDAAQTGELPPLLAEGGDGVIASLGTLDAGLLAVLQRAHLVPAATLAALDVAEVR